MLELGAGADILRSLGWLYIGLIVFLVALALWLPSRWWLKLVSVIGVLLIFTGPAYVRNRERGQIVDEHKARYEAAKALFDERCKTAGEKIYRTVENVEGVLLRKVRADDRALNEANPNWSGAGFPKESGGSQYIMEFLYYHRVPADTRSLHAVLPAPGGIRGYRHVDVEQDWQRVRYSLRKEAEYVAAADPVVAHGNLSEASDPLPHYAVTYEDIQDSEGRAQWIAGGRVTVTDIGSGELLGEFVQYSFEPGFGSRDGQRQPWAFALECPGPSPSTTTNGRIRLFVEKVIKPKQGE